MGRRSVVLGLSALFGSACSAPSLEIIAPELPDDVQWLGVILEREGVPLLGTGLVRRSETLSVEDLGDATEARVVGYTESSLSGLRLPSEEVMASGALRPARVDDRHVLPEPSWTGAGAIESGRVLASPSTSAGPLNIEWAPVCSRDPCDQVPFELPSVRETPGLRDVAVLLPWDTERREALGVTIWGEFLRVTEDDQIIHLTELSTSAYYRAALLLDDDRMLFGSTTGSLVVGRPESGFQTAYHTDRWPPNDRIELAAGRDEAGELEVFIVSRTGGLDRWNGTDIEIIRAGGEPTEDIGVAWVAPGEVWGISESANELFHYRDGQLRSQSVPAPTAIANIPGLGVVVSTRSGTDLTPKLLLATESELVELPGVPEDIGFASEYMWPLDRSDGAFVFGGTQGEIIYYFPGLGGCILPPVVPDLEPHHRARPAHLVVVRLEPLVRAEPGVEGEARDERGGLVAGLRQHLGERQRLLAQREDPVGPDPVRHRIRAGQDAAERRQRLGRVRERLLEQDALAREAVDGPRGRLAPPVALEAVRAQRVDHDEQDVRRPLRPGTAQEPRPRGEEGEEEEGAEEAGRGGLHRRAGVAGSLELGALVTGDGKRRIPAIVAPWSDIGYVRTSG